MDSVGKSGRRAIGLLVVVALGVAGSFMVWRTLRALEYEVAETAFRRDAEERRIAIDGKFKIALETLQSLASFFRVEPNVTREQFQGFTRPILDRHDYVAAFGWNVRVTAVDRAAFERRGKAIHGDFEITHRDEEAGTMVRAGDRSEYVSVLYIEPVAGNEAAVGLDTTWEPRRGRAFERAAETKRLTLTNPVQLVQDAERGGMGFLACIPIRNDGYVVGVYRPHEIVEEALGGLQDSGTLAIRLTDEDAQVTLFSQNLDDAARETGLVRERPLDYGERLWKLEMRPTHAYLAAYRSMAPHVALAVGLLVTALAAASLAIVLGRSARIKALVAERTGELTRANRGLAREITQRERVEDELTRHRDSLEEKVRTRTEALSGALERLSEAEERQRLTLDAIADGAWDWNVATGECRYSAPWVASLGYEPAEVPPHVGFWESLVHPEDLPRARAELVPHFEGRTQRYEFECRIRKKSGELRWTLSRGRVVARDAAGKPLRMVGTNTDITDRVRAEEEQRTIEQRLQHAQKLESLGVLAGGIAHDFNNLLVAMVSGTDLALQSTPTGAPARFPLERVKLAAMRASELTDQMLAYAGRNTLAREHVRLPALVEEMAQLLDASTSKKAALRVDAEADVPAVEGDPTQLRQVVMNLITNASDAVGDRAGTIAVRIGTITVGSQELAAMLLGDQLVPGDYVCLEVADTGMGMDEETVGRIFDPFFTTKFQGRGLGLAAVLGIVRSHGGAILVRSQPGEGTTFRVLLPCATQSGPAAPEPPAAPKKQQAAGPVLVIDDEAFVRDIARQVLEAGGFEVLDAADGPAGIEAFRARAEEIALVVLDMTMPRMSGTETIRELQAIRPDVRVLFSSGYSETSVARAVDEFQALGFIKKPYRVETFLDAVREAIGGPRGPRAGLRHKARRADP